MPFFVSLFVSFVHVQVEVKIPPPLPKYLVVYIVFIHVKKRKRTANYTKNVRTFTENWRELCASRKWIMGESSKNLILGKLKFWRFDDRGIRISWKRILSFDNVDSCTSLKWMASWAEVNAAKWCDTIGEGLLVFSINLLLREHGF